MIQLFYKAIIKTNHIFHNVVLILNIFFGGGHIFWFVFAHFYLCIFWGIHKVVKALPWNVLGVFGENLQPLSYIHCIL